MGLRLTSRTRHFLLSRFLHASEPDRYKADYWTTALRGPAHELINALTAEGLLMEAPLADALCAMHTAKELKVLAKTSGLKVSGTKKDLADRLVANDSAGITRKLTNRKFLVCSEHGRRVATKWLEQEAAALKNAESRVFELIRRRRFADAARDILSYESTQIFPRGLGVYESAGHFPEIETVFADVPKVLARANPGELEALRIAAAASLLWGGSRESHWLPAGFVTTSGFAPDVAVRMLVFYARQKRDLAGMSGFVRNVVISAANDLLTCDACRTLDGRKYPLAHAPELPHAYCTSEMGCRCHANADLETLNA